MPLILLKTEQLFVLLQFPNDSEEHPTSAFFFWEPVFNDCPVLVLLRTSFHLGGPGEAEGSSRSHSNSGFSWPVFLGLFRKLNCRLVHQGIKS